MNLRKRNELKSLFRNKSRLSETYFAELIDSMLNKRDDQFHGIWKPGQTYQKGDVVYYDCALWEMQSDNEICAKEEQPPGVSSDWKSLLKELEQKVDKLQHELERLCKEFTEYQKEMEGRLRNLARFIPLLFIGLAIEFFWLLGQSSIQ
ncbi:carbohydrate-binding protein [Scytonema sp. UIC 10036]|uniref:carbohydrate-binding protein n=1 Tax=Scytonema sp. UIC 10036 TaxID=2304196 RepID=UPI0012DAF33A|nr:carbohydrate-binding protein [Scytonema sp. UIC 10036]MUG97766.1 carbohydrate-binding protein [Scytonema sp. UIC 10036]